MKWKMNKFANRGEISTGMHEFTCDVNRMRGHESKPAAVFGFLIELIEKVMKGGVPFRMIFAVAVDILAKEGDFFISLVN